MKPEEIEAAIKNGSNPYEFTVGYDAIAGDRAEGVTEDLSLYQLHLNPECPVRRRCLSDQTRSMYFPVSTLTRITSPSSMN
jgi:hypothetical protein